MDSQLKEMRKLLEEIDYDLQSISAKRLSAKRERTEKPDRLESVIREECSEIKKMIREIDNQTIADSVSKMVVDRIMAPLQEAMGSLMSGKSEPRSIGMVAEDMKRKVERLSDRHIRVIKCISQAKGEWVNYDHLSGVCSISQSCLRGYISDLKRMYDIPIETSHKSGKIHVRIDPQTVKRLALGYHAVKVNAA
jgi:hypothetical protein